MRRAEKRRTALTPPSPSNPNPDAAILHPLRKGPDLEHVLALALAQELSARAPEVDLVVLASELANQAWAS